MNETREQDPQKTNDEFLAVRCQLGERAAIDELIERWHQPIWKYVRRITGDDDSAAEAVQDIWLRVLRAIPGLRDPGKLRAWLFGVARRTVMDRWRDKYSDAGLVSIDLSEIPDNAESGSGEEADLLNEGLIKLPVTEREILTLFYLEELPLTEVAEILEIPVGTVKSRLFRARKMLRQQLEMKGMDT